MQKIRLAIPLQTDSIVDGPGIRAVVWTQGCGHHCKGCHNQETWDFHGGTLYDIETVKQDIKALENHDGITLSGGDPLFQVQACYELAKYAKELELNVWCYTGFTFEQLLSMKEKDPYILKLLEQVDVLVDGRFELSQKSLNLKFKGSRNQRIIDVPKSLELGQAVLIHKYDQEKAWTQKYQKPEFLYI